MNPVSLTLSSPDWTALRILLSLSIREGHSVRIHGAAEFLNTDPRSWWAYEQIAALLKRYGIADIITNGSDILCVPGTVSFGIYDMELEPRVPVSELILMLAPALFKQQFRSVLNIKGATHAQWGLPVSCLRETLFSAMGAAGFNAGVNLSRFGFYGHGGGELEARIYPEKPVQSAASNFFSHRRISGAKVYFAGLQGSEPSAHKSRLASLLGIEPAAVSILDIMNSPGIHSSMYVFVETELFPVVLFREIEALTPEGEPVYTAEEALAAAESLAAEALDFREHGRLPEAYLKELVPYMVISAADSGFLHPPLKELAELCEKIIIP
jgi:RNA 3'-terminal phosphate cyclase